MQLEFDFDYPEQDKRRAEAKARLPVYTPLYITSKFFNILARCYQLDQSFNCHTFIQKYDLVKKRYIGGWIN